MKFKNWTLMILSVAILALLGFGLSSCGGGGSGGTTKYYTGSTSLGSSASFSVDEAAGVINYNIAGVDGKINGVGKSSCLNSLYYYTDNNSSEPTYAYFSNVVGTMKTNNKILVGFTNAYQPIPEGEYTYIDKDGDFHTLSVTYTTDDEGYTITTTSLDGAPVQDDLVKYSNGMVIVEKTGMGMGVRDGNGIDSIESLNGKTFDFFISSNMLSSFGKINITDTDETEATGNCKKTSSCSTTGAMSNCINNDASITPIDGRPGGWFKMKIDSSSYTVFISRSGYFMGVGSFGSVIVGKVY